MSSATELTDMRERASSTQEAWAAQREMERECHRFEAGEQWDAVSREKRLQEKRPVIRVNRTAQFVKQITNEQRQNRSSVSVSPRDDAADKQTADVLQGLFRQIADSSDEDTAVDTAFQHMMIGGRGHFGWMTQYESPASFDQCIVARTFDEPEMVELDPWARHPVSADMRWGFVYMRVDETIYKKMYPKSELSGLSSWSGMERHAPGWIGQKSVLLGEYWTREAQPATLVMTPEGPLLFDEKSPQPEGLVVLAERAVEQWRVRQRLTNGLEWLGEETEWPGQWIPLIPLYGDCKILDGRRLYMGMVQDLMDPAKLYNFMVTSAAEMVMLAPRAPYIGAVGQFETHRQEWDTASEENYSRLEYDPREVNGNLLPPPQRQTFEPAIQAISQMVRQASEDLKAASGIYDAALGAKSNETSGKAILERKEQSHTANFNFLDNLRRSQRHSWRVVMDAIPGVYDGPRIVRIIGKDDQPTQVSINQFLGESGGYFLGRGAYDVSISTQPSYRTQRQEAVSAITALYQMDPQAAQRTADLFVKMQDWHGAEDFAARLVPPDIQQQQAGARQDPRQLAAQVQQLQQLAKELQGALQAAQDERSLKEMEIKSKEYVAEKQIEGELLKKEMELGSKENIALLQNTVQRVEQMIQRMQVQGPAQEGGNGQVSAPMAGPPEEMTPEMMAPAGAGVGGM